MADIRTTDRLVSAMTPLGNSRESTILAMSSCLRLAASPAFAIMALLAATQDRSLPDALCSTTHNAAPFPEMVTMYLLMSLFHLPSWLKLISDRRAEITPGPTPLWSEEDTAAADVRRVHLIRRPT